LAAPTEAESRLANRRVGSRQRENLERLRSGDVTGKLLLVGAALQKGEFSMTVIASGPGLVLVDDFMNLVAANSEAVQILAFPDSPEKLGHLSGWLTKKIRSCLIDRK
jgi:hypothetical protein